MAESYSILYIYDFFIHSSVHVYFCYFHVSAVVNAAAVYACVQCCSVATSILQNPDSPHETLNPLSPPSAPGTHHPAFCVYGVIALGALYEWTQISFVLPCLPYVSEHNVFRVHPRCSLCQNCLPFRLTTFIVWMDHILLVHPSVEGHTEYLHSSLTSCSICGITSESPII